MSEYRLLLLLLALSAGALAVLLEEPLSRPARAERSREFQQLVGGLGFGPVADLSQCAFSFDPRLCPGCPQQYGPVPAGAIFCPYHGCAILAYPPLETIDHVSPP